jgi:hypothetical protein
MFTKFCFWCDEEFEITPSKGLVEACPKCAGATPLYKPCVICPTCERALQLPKDAASKVGKILRCPGFSIEGYGRKGKAVVGTNIGGDKIYCGTRCRLVKADTDTGFALEAVE